MRVLAFDHFFDQDLDALKAARKPSDTFDVLPYRRLHKLAQAHFPEAAFDTLDAPFTPELASSWDAYRPAAQAFTDWLAAAYRPDVFVVPNDNFFYLRPLIEAFRVRGVPTVVVQKETTIAPLTMDEDSEVIRRNVPFMADVMTVCSARHKEFAIRCGAQPAQVIVTGQPRFDVYANARSRGTRTDDGPPSVLYLSYDDLSYLPGDGSLGSWRQLRNETEWVLAELASVGTLHVVAKLHPQQQARDDALGAAVARAPQGADTRQLIADADVVVGFQTTALFEAALAGRPVVYAAWGDVYERAEHLLIPFAEHPELALHVRSADELARRLAEVGTLPRAEPAGVALAEEHLGPVDGHATERVLEIVRRSARHEPLADGRPPPMRRVAVAAVRGAGSPAARAAAAVLDRGGRHQLAAAARRHAGYWSQEGREGLRIARGRLSNP